MQLLDNDPIFFLEEKYATSYLSLLVATTLYKLIFFALHQLWCRLSLFKRSNWDFLPRLYNLVLLAYDTIFSDENHLDLYFHTFQNLTLTICYRSGREALSTDDSVEPGRHIYLRILHKLGKVLSFIIHHDFSPLRLRFFHKVGKLSLSLPNASST